MVERFRFAVQALEFGDRDALVELARSAEQLGYEELYTADHVGMPDPLLPLISVAEATTRLRLGPLVLNNELHHPVLLARSFATADQLSGGRMILGIGTGYMQSEHDATGIELREPPDRVSRLEESLVVLRSLLQQGAASHDGAHYNIQLDELGITASQQPLPLLVGGHGRRVVGIAGRHADIFQFTGLTHGAGGVPEPGGFGIDAIRQRSRWLAEAAGDRSDQIERSALVQRTAIGPGADQQIEGLIADRGIERSMIEQTPFLLMGSIEQVVDKIERLRDDVGISHFVVRDAEGFAPVVDRFS